MAVTPQRKARKDKGSLFWVLEKKKLVRKATKQYAQWPALAMWH
jgi:hypothetical protein